MTVWRHCSSVQVCSWCTISMKDVTCQQCKLPLLPLCSFPALGVRSLINKNGTSCWWATGTERVWLLNRIQIISKLSTYMYCVLVSLVSVPLLLLRWSSHWDPALQSCLPQAGFHGLNLDISYSKCSVRYSAWLLSLLWMCESLLSVLCHTSHLCRRTHHAWVVQMALAASMIELPPLTSGWPCSFWGSLLSV